MIVVPVRVSVRDGFCPYGRGPIRKKRVTSPSFLKNIIPQLRLAQANLNDRRVNAEQIQRLLRCGNVQLCGSRRKIIHCAPQYEFFIFFSLTS
ncbi:Polycomb Group Ring Finger Protein 3 [Manis pentadactyla]|nr:Polycomb Group Ring Finger Protein 3 [Manis pentadactyla]